MKVALVRPHYPTHIITPPLGLGYLASYLAEAGIDVDIIDALRDNLSNSAVCAIVAQRQPDAVGITCLTAFYAEVVDLSLRLKAAGMRVIIGGPHPTFLPYETLQDSCCDCVVAGEGERALLQLATTGFRTQGIRGVYSLETLPQGSPPPAKAATVENLDELAFPDWKQLDPRGYPKAPHGAIARNYPIGVIMTTRGCPHRCSFCASSRFYDRRVRFRSPENVVQEIKFLIANFGVREIHFEDDNLTLRRDHIERLCHLLLGEGIKVSWACPNGIRADRVDAPLLRLMKQSGCYYVAFGIESASPQILTNICKQEPIETITQSIAMAADAGIACQGFFILGLPGETAATLEETIRFARHSRLSRAQFLILDVLPGSELWDRLQGQFLPQWGKKSYQEPEWLPVGLTRRELMQAQSRAFRDFYLKSPRRLIPLLCSARPAQLLHLVHRISDYRILGSRDKAA